MPLAVNFTSATETSVAAVVIDSSDIVCSRELVVVCDRFCSMMPDAPFYKQSKVALVDRNNDVVMENHLAIFIVDVSATIYRALH